MLNRLHNSAAGQSDNNAPFDCLGSVFILSSVEYFLPGISSHSTGRIWLDDINGVSSISSARKCSII